MKLRTDPQGYTIVETMVFLAVSAALFVSAAALMSGQQNRTEFAQAIREVESEIQDVINDVATGYYTNTNDFTCDATAPGPPIITYGVAGRQGANRDCIFIGRRLQFAPNTNPASFNVYTVVGRRLNALGGDASDYDSAQPIILDPATNVDKRQIQNGLTVKTIKFKDPITATDVYTGSFGLLATFGQQQTTSPTLVSGDNTVDLVPFRAPDLNQAPGGSAIDNTIIPDKNPADGVTLCFESGGTQQFGIITIGSNGRRLTTNLRIENKSPIPAECS